MKPFLGEILGTFILVFVGLATVANAAILEMYEGLVQVALLWGLGVCLAVTISGPISGAHLNPAITIAFATTTEFSWRRVPAYITAQCMGATLAALLVLGLYGDAITSYETAAGITRGSDASVRTAMVFGEFYPNPAAATDNPALQHVSATTAFLAEALGTAVLAFVVFCIIRRSDLPGGMIPVLIGLTLTVLISLLAPLSMGGFNPARDLMPRIVSSLSGWGSIPFTANGQAWLTIYVIAPIIGAVAGASLAKLVMGQPQDSGQTKP